LSFNFTVLVVLAFAAYLGFGRGKFRFPDLSAPQRMAIVVGACATLVASVIVRASIDASIVASQHPGVPASELRYAVMFDGVRIDASASNLALVLSFVQSLGLGCLVWGLNDGKRGAVRIAVVVCSMAAMFVISACETTLKSADLIAYAGYATLGQAAYHPPNVPFAHSFGAIHRYWGLPMIPCPYGPAWLALARVATVNAHSLEAKIDALRALSGVALLACTLLLMLGRRERDRFAIVAAFALNPALYEQFVVDGHNDIIGIAFVLGAMFLIRTPYVATLLVAAAICVKLPFALVGAVVFSDIPNLRRRTLFAGAAMLLGVGVTFVLVGPRYASVMLSEATRRPFSNLATGAVHAACLAAAIAAVVAAVGWRKFGPGGVLPFAGIGVLPFPWYVVWSVPYALQAGYILVLLVALPALSGLFSSAYEDTGFRQTVDIATFVSAFVVAAIVYRRSRQRASALVA